MNRRIFLKKITSFAVIFTGALFRPVIALAEWNREAFSSTDEKSALEKFFPGEKIADTDLITIGVYDTVENGAYVPVKIDSDLKNIKSITILVEKNPNPLIANFNLGDKSGGFIATRIKMDTSSDIIAIVRSGNNLYSKRKFVEILAGGCG